MFHGEFQDNDTGLYNYGYRFYNTSLGRWLRRDPIGELGGLNLYAFVGNRPVNSTDSLGLSDGMNHMWAKIQSCAELFAMDVMNVDKLAKGLKSGYENMKLWADRARKPIEYLLKRFGMRFEITQTKEQLRDEFQQTSDNYRDRLKSSCDKAKKILDLFNTCCGPLTPGQQTFVEVATLAVGIYCDIEKWPKRIPIHEPEPIPVPRPIEVPETEVDPNTIKLVIIGVFYWGIWQGASRLVFPPRNLLGPI